MKKYFIRLFLALLNRPYCADCDLSGIGAFRRDQVNPEFLATIDALEDNLKMAIKDSRQRKEDKKS